MVVHRKIAWISNQNKRRNRLDQGVHDWVHDMGQLPVNGTLETYKLFKGHDDMFAQCTDFCKVWVWR